jgi:hypothetical protein
VTALRDQLTVIEEATIEVVEVVMEEEEAAMAAEEEEAGEVAVIAEAEEAVTVTALPPHQAMVAHGVRKSLHCSSVHPSLLSSSAG